LDSVYAFKAEVQESKAFKPRVKCLFCPYDERSYSRTPNTLSPITKQDMPEPRLHLLIQNR